MNILLSNDDGYQAPGLACLAAMLERQPHVSGVTVVAPDRERSGASNSLTLESPLRASRADNGFIRVNGTPTDCVHLAITGLLDTPPDIVIAGINAGANLGDDVLYSGTVAAAMEGRTLGLPALAVSLAGQSLHHYATAAKVVERLLQRLHQRQLQLPDNTILNINVPDRPWDDLQGMEVVRLGHRHRAEAAVRAADPHGNPVYWVGPPGPAQDAGPGTDFYAIQQGRVALTPLQVDLTRHAALAPLAAWLNDSP